MLLAALLLFALAACNKSPEEAGAAGSPSSSAAPAPVGKTQGTNVEVLRLAPQDMVLHSTYVGHLLPRQRVILRSEQEGAVEAVFFEASRPVEKNALLANLATHKYTVRRNQARSGLELAVENLAGDQLLFEKKLIPPAQLDRTRNARDLAGFTLELAEIDLKNSIVRAPIKGIPKSREIEVGEFLNKGQLITEILDISSVRALIHVPELEVHALRSGQQVAVAFDALGGKRYSGAVSQIGLEADLRNRSFPVEVTIANKSQELRPGMLARVTVKVRAFERQVLVPRHALLERAERRVVFVAGAGKVREATVRTGSSSDGMVQILAGLKFGEQVVVTGQQQLTPGERITVTRILE